MNRGTDDNLINEKTKRHKTIYIVITAIVILIAALVLTSVQKKKAVVRQTNNFYYLDLSKEYLRFEERYVSGKTEEEIVGSVLETLKGKPMSEALFPSIPESVEFGRYWLNNGTVYLNIIVPDDAELKAYDILMYRGSIIWTLTDLDFIDGVCFIVNGEPIRALDGEYLGILTREDFIIDASNVSPEPLDEMTVTLYFANSESTGLESEQRVIAVNPNQELGRFVVEELIKGPEKEGLKATIPEGTKILDLKIVDNVCYIDLNSDFVLKHSGGTTEELITIYSIVNSLTAINGIDKVQFLIDGEKQNVFKGAIDFSVQFTASDLYVETQ